MEKNIIVPFLFNSRSIEITVRYSVEIFEHIQIVYCKICRNEEHHPQGLQLHKFELRSLLVDGVCVPLYNDHENIKNVNTLMFIDKVYAEIMSKEKYKTAVL